MGTDCNIVVIILLTLLAIVTAQEPPGPEVNPAELPSIPATEPKDALKTFEIRKGYQLQLVAHEPLVMDPVAISFDENGRMFVVEMRDYSERRDEKLGRIKMLEDTDGDGVFDKDTIFAKDLPWPTAVICYRGGVFVGVTPDILYLKDTNGDGVADYQKVIYTGFGNDVEKLNVQTLVNGFNWGLDNRIHGTAAGNGGQVRQEAGSLEPIETRRPGAFAPVNLRNRNFRFDPRSLKIEPQNIAAQYGMSFDSTGRLYVCSNGRHLMTYMYDSRYAEQSRFYDPPASMVNIAVDGPAAEVFRISPDEPWRVIRTKWRVTGVVPGTIEGGGRVSGYFTSATGATIYRGNALGREFEGNAFIGDVGSNLVHRKLIRREGAELKAERPADEHKTEFLRSRDNWFRPVQFANAPDGALYVLDMYRQTIEHPWSLPESIKKHLDLNAGNDRGRIYRVVPEGFKQPRLPKLGKATTEELVATLEHPNGWHRDTASRLIFERQDVSAVPLLETVLNGSKSAVARLHALYALHGLSKLTEEHVVAALGDADENVRENVLRLLEEKSVANGLEARATGTQLAQLAADPSPIVRYQLALSLGLIKHPNRLEILHRVLARDLASRWTRAAVLMSANQEAGAMFARVKDDRKIVDSPAGKDFIRQLASIVGARNQADEIQLVLDFASRMENPADGLALGQFLGQGLERAGSSLAKFHAARALFEKADAVLKERKAWDPLESTCRHASLSIL